MSGISSWFIFLGKIVSVSAETNLPLPYSIRWVAPIRPSRAFPDARVPREQQIVLAHHDEVIAALGA
ncbi:hypothetical protein [Rhodovulum bhavnagarense]|uniref:hypothetical protein n=1 Tax=Rhodovulum bhavnagarense TaxID=992286 RepID=UPI00104A3B04|nr:hypothetical protein [Rhodovulum bhavnagarense]